MPFNIADTFKRSLAIPIQKGVSATAQAASGLIFSTTKTASQNTSDFGVATASQKSAEAIDKVVNQGTADQFDSVNRQIKMMYENQTLAIKEADTNKTLGKVGDLAPAPSVPAEFLKSGNTPAIEELKVTITQEPKGIRTTVVFDVMPTIDESRSVQYEPFTPLHHPGEILKYKNTGGRSWTISAKLVSRNVEEASKNYAMIQSIRSWAMPYYGAGTQKTHPDILGAPPPILTLQAYGKNMIGPVKCVMESYSWQWPNDVDFLPAVDLDGKNRPFPVILNISITLKEAWSPAEFSGFSINHYQMGDMPVAFSAIARTSRPQTFVPVGSAENRDAIRRSEAQIVNQGAVNKASSNIASNVPPSNGSISPPSLATPGYNPDAGQIGGAIPGTDIYGNR